MTEVHLKIYDEGFADGNASADAEIARLQEQLSHAVPAIEQLTKEREEYRMRWLGSMTPEEAVLIRAENERLRAALHWALGDNPNAEGNDRAHEQAQERKP